MHEQNGAGSLDRRVLRLNPGFDPASMRPSSVEFFLLSRIDGCTPWCVLREMGGMTAEESDLCLEGWLAAGHVQVSHIDGAGQKQALPLSADVDRAPLVIDSELDIDVAIQKRVIEMLLLLDESDQSLLGVGPDCDEKAIKRAYFRLSREFHPDRFFRRELGPYRSEIEKLFKGIQRAYVNLSQAPAKSPMSRGSESKEPQTSLLHQEGRIHGRSGRGHSVPDHVHNEHYQKARELMKAASDAMVEGRLDEAHKCLQIAGKFCPEYPSLDQAMADVLAKMKKNSEKDEKVLDVRSRVSVSACGDIEHRRSELFCRGET
ncbi:MAG: J domain-containing protein [Myxococcota bacterium]|nr:J domain-containing protein [Myxococcota bacterium]